MRIIVGLGNPGDKYRCTRHNIGFRCVDLMARQWDLPLSERRAKAMLGAGRHLEQDIVLAKPRTFMNNSGEGVAYLLTRFAAQPSDLIIIYDEMALPLGKLRIRPSGSDGGHNGIRSIIADLRTQSFPRVRVGIGPPTLEGNRVSHVLTRFTQEEAPIINQAVARVLEAVECLLTEDIQVAMNRFN
jgi:peptidyl-tRNA hydrolase, PTH1 family